MTRTKREQNTAEEQNVNELWRVEQNVNIQKSSTECMVRQYDADMPLHIVTHESIRFDMHSLHGRIAIFAFETALLFSNYIPTKRGNSVSLIP